MPCSVRNVERLFNSREQLTERDLTLDKNLEILLFLNLIHFLII